MDSSPNNPNEKDQEEVFKYLQKRVEPIKNFDKEDYDLIQEFVNQAISAWGKARDVLLSIDMKDIYELRVPSKAPSEEVERVICACMYLMAGHTSEHHIKINKRMPAEVNWNGCQRMLNGWHRLKVDMLRVDRLIECEEIDWKRIEAAKGYMEKSWFNVEELKGKSQGAAKFADFVVNVVKSAEIIRELRPRIQCGLKKAETKSQEKED